MEGEVGTGDEDVEEDMVGAGEGTLATGAGEVGRGEWVGPAWLLNLN